MLELASIVARAVELASPLFEARGPAARARRAADRAAGRRRSRAARRRCRQPADQRGQVHRAHGPRSPFARRVTAADVRVEVRDDGIGIAARDAAAHLRPVRAGAPGARPLAGRPRARPRDRAQHHASCTAGRRRRQRGARAQAASSSCACPPALAAATPVAAPPSRGPTRARAERQRLRVLVVDDNEDAATLLATSLAMKRASRARGAYDGPAALSAAAELQPGSRPARHRPARDGRLRTGGATAT